MKVKKCAIENKMGKKKGNCASMRIFASNKKLFS